MSMSNVSVEGIKAAVEKLVGFKESIHNTGLKIQDGYVELNQSLRNPMIDEAIEKQKQMLEDIELELTRICTKAEEEMTRDGMIIKQQQEDASSVIGNV